MTNLAKSRKQAMSLRQWHKKRKKEEAKGLREAQVKEWHAERARVPEMKVVKFICAGCGKEAKGAAMLYCQTCRHAKISFELASKDIRARVPSEEEVQMFEQMQRHENDFRIRDENGVECWASDLARRYRKELSRRQQRDYRER